MPWVVLSQSGTPHELTGRDVEYGKGKMLAADPSSLAESHPIIGLRQVIARTTPWQPAPHAIQGLTHGFDQRCGVCVLPWSQPQTSIGQFGIQVVQLTGVHARTVCVRVIQPG